MGGRLLVVVLAAGIGTGGCADPAEADAVHPMPALGKITTPGPVTSEARSMDIAWLPATVSRHSALLIETGVRHRVDPEMLAIVALVESGGWVKARSPSGARGLMQLMPATANVIAAERGLAEHDRDKLYDPAYNIDFGAWYLARQLAQFGTEDGDESVELAAAAYNGGPGRLRRHLDGDETLSDETKRYKHWVRAMWQQRRDAGSAAFDAWRNAGGERLLERARAEGDG